MGRMLDLMERENIFAITVIDKKILIYERCDSHFDAQISPDDLKELGQEIIDLAENLRPEVLND